MLGKHSCRRLQPQVHFSCTAFSKTSLTSTICLFPLWDDSICSRVPEALEQGRCGPQGGTHTSAVTRQQLFLPAFSVNGRGQEGRWQAMAKNILLKQGQGWVGWRWIRCSS